jgi:DNA helicase-2/ATP-dependent DNA helicase PcrA
VIFDGLNPEQRRAVEVVRGPVCILAGAGSGKTTTITRRIANQVATGAFRSDQVLAVTFTDKAAGELRERLAALGAHGVQARTFHSAALAQLRYFVPDRVGKIVASKALTLRHIGNTLPRPYRFRPAGDLASEVEWAKNRRIPPDRYLAELGDHEPPIPADLMARVYREYERRKREGGVTDFEDMLELAVRLYEDDDGATMEFRDRYRAFTVDEYQDVNPLQQALLDCWLGSRDELCVVGDDYQSIYAFTGAGPQYLLGTPARFPHATIVRLEANYRSTAQVLELANRLVPRLGGAEKTLRPTRPDGPEPTVRPFATTEFEYAFVVGRIGALHGQGTALEEMALLCRTNARLADFEEVLHEADVPFQGAALLEREAARRLLRRLRDPLAAPLADAVRQLALEAGWLEDPPDRLGTQEQTRQNDLGRLVRLAADLPGEPTAADFAADLQRRFGSGGAEARGVHLLTYHRAKGLEFDAVFLPRLEEKELPAKSARTPAELAEERRLLYVGMTRARRHLTLTWSKQPSRFLEELGISAVAPRALSPRASELPPAARVLRAWRLERARSEGVPAYVVFPDRTIEEIVRLQPATLAELARIPGLGSTRLERFGEELLQVVVAALAATDETPNAAPAPFVEPDDPLYRELSTWRRARADRGVPAFHVFGNRTLDAIVRARPQTLDELAEVPGVGPLKLERYGEEVIEALTASAEAA